MKKINRPDQIRKYLHDLLDKHTFAIHEWNTSKNFKVWVNLSQDYWEGSELGSESMIGKSFIHTTPLGDKIKINFNNSGWRGWIINGKKISNDI